MRDSDEVLHSDYSLEGRFVDPREAVASGVAQCPFILQCILSELMPLVVSHDIDSDGGTHDHAEQLAQKYQFGRHV